MEQGQQTYLHSLFNILYQWHITKIYALFAYALRPWRLSAKISPSPYAFTLSGRLLKLLDPSFRKSGTQGILPFPLNPRQMNEVTRYKSTQLLGSCSWESRSHCKDSVKTGNAANPSTAKNHLTLHYLNRQKPKLILTSKLIPKRMSQHKKFLRGFPHLETKARQKSYAF